MACSLLAPSTRSYLAAVGVLRFGAHKQHVEGPPEDAGLIQQSIHFGRDDERVRIEIHRVLQQLMQSPHVQLSEAVGRPSRNVNAAAPHWWVRDTLHVLHVHMPRCCAGPPAAVCLSERPRWHRGVHRRAVSSAAGATLCCFCSLLDAPACSSAKAQWDTAGVAITTTIASPALVGAQRLSGHATPLQ
jgi:hypothetical protein